TPEMLDFVSFTGVSSGFNKQHVLLGQMRGPVVKLPNGGDIVVAVGGDYRREAGGYQPDPFTAAGDTIGATATPTRGHHDVIEGFGEVSIVPVRGKAWARWLELSAAARVVDYTTFGTNLSWKTG